MKPTLGQIETQIDKILERNKRVELDKAWETSWTRRLSIAVLTYGTIGIFMHSMGVENPWINAIVPSIGFILSTLSLPYIKSFWIKKHS